MKRVLDILFLSVVMIVASSCNRDEVITILPPEIIVEGSGEYCVKVGEEIRLAPEYRQADGATFEWRIDGEVVGTGSDYIYYAEAVGEVYVLLTVENEAGSDSEEMRIDVVEPMTPTIDIAMDDTTVAIGYVRELRANLRKTELETEIFWTLNGERVAEGDSYRFEAVALGEYLIEATAKNSDGEASDSVKITVVDAKDIPFVYEFERSKYHTVEGRVLRIKPTAVSDTDGVEYSWEVDGSVVEGATEPYYLFSSDSAGDYTLRATATISTEEGEQSVAREFDIKVYRNGEFRRERSATSQSAFERVVEYTPAPGQFIGELRTGGFKGEEYSAESATAYAEGRLREGMWVSLGAFGGYIVVGFDHSVENGEGADLAIKGNSFDGSSEPGIVWVMQDENGNGMADDTWYELRGSEWGKEETIQEYEVTYYRPSGAAMSVEWYDNLGNSGCVDYLRQFHNQDSYYPQWIAADSYTLRGTRLEARNYDKSGNGSLWVQPAYDWGYTDNNSTIDSKNAVNSLDIANAVDICGEAIELEYIDFVKIQCGVQAKSGWLGELSTEVCGVSEILR